MLKEDALCNLGEDIRNMRKGMGMTLEKLAEALDTDFRVLSRYENGQVEMGALMYRRLVRLHDRKTKNTNLLQQIRLLSPTDRTAIETIVTRMKTG